MSKTQHARRLLRLTPYTRQKVYWLADYDDGGAPN